eukprot:scaffold129762_cov18-Tisochrysis_lutea.AAC.2
MEKKQRAHLWPGCPASTLTPRANKNCRVACARAPAVRDKAAEVGAQQILPSGMRCSKHLCRLYALSRPSRGHIISQPVAAASMGERFKSALDTCSLECSTWSRNFAGGATLLLVA